MIPVHIFHAARAEGVDTRTRTVSTMADKCAPYAPVYVKPVCSVVTGAKDLVVSFCIPFSVFQG